MQQTHLVIRADSDGHLPESSDHSTSAKARIHWQVIICAQARAGAEHLHSDLDTCDEDKVCSAILCS